VKEEIARILSQREKKTIRDAGLVLSAVLVPLYEDKGEYHILFTKRADKLASHRGQVSFPGGTYDEGDGDLKVTALRESFEELGLREKDVEILGQLDDEVSMSNYVMAPFVGYIPNPYEFRINKDEIDEMFGAPISMLLDRNNFREEDTQVLGGRSFARYFFQYQGYVIWGATARILKHFLDLIFQQG
jgi:8-oxo-dGTP pyrophosphatase MutT (NUDIX family)